MPAGTLTLNQLLPAEVIWVAQVGVEGSLKVPGDPVMQLLALQLPMRIGPPELLSSERRGSDGGSDGVARGGECE